MVSLERSKKKIQLWKKAIVHFLLCFIMGFFTGIAPTSKSSIFSTQVDALQRSEFSPQFSPQPVVIYSDHQAKQESGDFNRSMLNESLVEIKIQTRRNESKSNSVERVQEQEEKENAGKLVPRRLVIIVTPTIERDKLRGVLLRKLANTLSLVPPPLLWVVVERQSESSEVSEILRQTRVMYRHLVFKENFTDPEVEMDHQRNVALNHIEHHRLSGIVHFAALSNVYDLDFFDEIRAIEVFGTWRMAFVSANRNRVIIKGPVCDSSEVMGWHLKNMNNLTEAIPTVHISSFGFNSSILWDPERWGRLSSAQDTSQDSIKFVKEEVLEEETKLKRIPLEGCSKIMLWSLHIPGGIKTNI